MSLAEESYRRNLKEFTKVAKRSFEASINAKGVHAGARRYWASVLLTRICSLSASILFICPGSVLNEKGRNWDFESIAALTRSLFEAILVLFYLGLECLPDDEWYLRFHVVNLADCTERIRIFYELDDHDNVAWGVPTAVLLRARITANPAFHALPEKLRKELLTGERPFLLGKREIIKRVGEDPASTLWYYRLLSNYLHFYPLGFHRTGIHGRDGTENEVDKGNMAVALHFAAKWLNKAVIDFEDQFSDLVTFGTGSFDFDAMAGRTSSLDARDEALISRVFSSRPQF